MEYQNNIDFARAQDQADELGSFRDRFLFPKKADGSNKVYFTGNSLGLQPKGSLDSLKVELDDWAKYGVDGHFEARNPWFSYHERFREPLAKIVGAKPLEVAAMGSLTANLHFLMVSFFNPKGKKCKILCEAKAFPSDQYALETQLKHYGLDPKENLIEVAPREGEYHLREEDIMDQIKANKDELALIMIGGVNYYSGQLMPMEAIAKLAQELDITVGFDLAHAAGNVELKLHDWGVDFAAWCSYKYLNSGPGSVAGIFVHEKHSQNAELDRFAGWWGVPAEDRFMMQPGYKPAEGADAWQLSNAPVLAMAVHKLALDIHNEAGMDRLLKKQKQLWGYTTYVLEEIAKENSGVQFEVITPESHGAQISLLLHGEGKELFNRISEKGVVVDWREPNVIRLAPTPLYNSFEDVYEFGKLISESLSN
ncbi:MAG: kynureninase [Flavobacteriales bacterium]|nr:kynureninase [Flavobacteriales bacterium]